MSQKVPPTFFKILRHPLNNIRSQTALRSMCSREVKQLLQYKAKSYVNIVKLKAFQLQTLSLVNELLFRVTDKLQSWTKYMEQNKEIKQNGTDAENFVNYFCVLFGCYYKTFVYGGKTGH